VPPPGRFREKDMSIKSVLQEGDPLRYDFGCWRVVSVNE
jgi:hypothetical protein